MLLSKQYILFISLQPLLSIQLYLFNLATSQTYIIGPSVFNHLVVVVPNNVVLLKNPCVFVTWSTVHRFHCNAIIM